MKMFKGFLLGILTALFGYLAGVVVCLFCSSEWRHSTCNYIDELMDE